MFSFSLLAGVGKIASKFEPQPEEPSFVREKTWKKVHTATSEGNYKKKTSIQFKQPPPPPKSLADLP